MGGAQSHRGPGGLGGTSACPPQGGRRRQSWPPQRRARCATRGTAPASRAHSWGLRVAPPLCRWLRRRMLAPTSGRRSPESLGGPLTPRASTMCFRASCRMRGAQTRCEPSFMHGLHACAPRPTAVLDRAGSGLVSRAPRLRTRHARTPGEPHRQRVHRCSCGLCMHAHMHGSASGCVSVRPGGGRIADGAVSTGGAGARADVQAAAQVDV